jgi:antitoxin CptB
MSARTDTIEDIEVRRKRLIFRSWHRGTREMDLLLGRFADAHIAGFSESELAEYEALLQVSDPDLYNWITGVEEAPANLGSVFTKLKLMYQV